MSGESQGITIWRNKVLKLGGREKRKTFDRMGAHHDWLGDSFRSFIYFFSSTSSEKGDLSILLCLSQGIFGYKTPLYT